MDRLSPTDNTSSRDVVSSVIGDSYSASNQVAKTDITSSSEPSVQLVFDADYQHHLIHKVTPIQSVTFDKRVPVSLRPQALVMATPILQRHSQFRIEQDFSDHMRFHLGDMIDTSNDVEWMLYLISYLDENIAAELFGLEGDVANWSTDEWVSFWNNLDEFKHSVYLNRIIAYYQKNNIVLPAGPEGNHDGAAWGNGVALSKSLAILELQVISLQLQIEGLKKDLARLEEKNNTRIENKIKHLRTRLEFLEERLHAVRPERDKARERFYNQSLKRSRVKLPRFAVDAFQGLRKGQALTDPQGYWALNSGGVEHNFNKADYLYHYLKLRYPHLQLSENLEPLVTRLISSWQDDVSDATPFDGYKVENVRQEAAGGGYRRNERGTYDYGESHYIFLENLNDRQVDMYFSQFWKEVRPGEFVSLVAYPGANYTDPYQSYVMLQAFAVGEVNGRQVYHLVLDGMDGTDQDADTAFFGHMSRFQRQLCDLFLDCMRLKHRGQALFVHSSHYPLEDHVKDYWKEFGWQDYFAQSDVAPVLFSGHKHRRELIDETKPTVLGKPFFLGRRSVVRPEGFLSVVSPSVTDDPNGFMSVEVSYDGEKDAYVIGQKYHDLVPEEQLANLAPDVVQAVDRLRDLYRHNEYHKYTRLRSGFLPGLKNVFFNQDRILAYDAIPVSRGRFEEALVYARSWLDFLIADFGKDDPFTGLVVQVIYALEKHFDAWLSGDPLAEDKFDQMGYLKAVEEADRLSRIDDKVALLSHFNDVFDHPAYEMLRLLIAQTPRDSRAYDFWLLLGLKAAREEQWRKVKNPVADENIIAFRIE